MPNKVYTKLIFSVLFLFLAITVSAQNNSKNSKSGWTYTKNSSVVELEINEKDSLMVDFLSIKADTGLTILQNQFDIPETDSGMIKIEAFIDNVISQNDSTSPAMFVHVKMGAKIVALKDPRIVDLLGRSSSGKVTISIPFDRKINNLYLGFVLNPNSLVSCRNYRIKITQGEFSKEWESTHSSKFQTVTDFAANLQLLGKVWGYLKYFSPKISDEDIAWDRILINNIDTLFKNTDRENFLHVITKLVDTATYENSCTLTSSPVLDSATAFEKMNIDYTWIFDSSVLDERLKDQLLSLSRCYQHFENDYVKTPVETGKPSPHFAEDGYDKNSLPEYRYRLLSLFRYWNIIEYYGPYKYLIKERWSHILEELIPEFTAANTSSKYTRALLKLNASIKDGHATTSSSLLPHFSLRGNGSLLPIRLTLLDGKAYLAKIDTLYAKHTGMKPGDEVVSINGYGVQYLIETLRSGISHVRREMKDRVITQHNLLARTPIQKDSSIVEFVSNGTIGRASIYQDQNYFKQYDFKPFWTFQKRTTGGNGAYQLISDSILYVNVEKWKNTDVPTTKNLLAVASNVIIDCRYYPSWDFIEFAPVFFQDTTDMIKFMVVQNYPGLLKEQVARSIPSSDFRYKGNIYVLMSEESLSRPEMLIMFLKSIKKNIYFVGRTSAGADGDIASIPMIGRNNMEFIYSGLGVFFPDNTATQGVGIEPDTYITETKAEFIDGEDVILKNTIDLIKKKRIP